MQLFILGILLGSGLVLAAQEIKRQLSARSSRRHKAAVDEAIALLADNTVLGTDKVDWDSLKGWGVIDSTPDTDWSKR